MAEPGQSAADDLARVEAVRDALGPDGAIRVDANAAWDVDTAVARISGARPRGPRVRGAAVRRRSRTWSRCAVGSTSGSPPTRWCAGAADPLRVDLREACDVVVLKVQPLGGVRAALRVAEAHGLPCVVSAL